MKRDVVFKMERPGLVEEGQKVEITESVTPFNVNYVVEPAVAMSGLFRLNDRLKSREGIVKEIVENDRGFYITVTFDDDAQIPAFCSSAPGRCGGWRSWRKPSR